MQEALTFVDLRPVWDMAVQVARARNAQKRAFASTRAWRTVDDDSRSTHLVGILGEYIYAVAMGKTVNAQTKLNGDGGHDFVAEGVEGGVDVKASTYWPPILKHPANSTRWPAVFALVYVDLNHRRGALVGTVQAETLQRAPIRTFTQRAGPQRCLSAEQIIAGRGSSVTCPVCNGYGKIIVRA